LGEDKATLNFAKSRANINVIFPNSMAAGFFDKK